MSPTHSPNLSPGTPVPSKHVRGLSKNQLTPKQDTTPFHTREHSKQAWPKHTGQTSHQRGLSPKIGLKDKLRPHPAVAAWAAAWVVAWVAAWAGGGMGGMTGGGMGGGMTGGMGGMGVSKSFTPNRAPAMGRVGPQNFRGGGGPGPTLITTKPVPCSQGTGAFYRTDTSNWSNEP